MKCLVRYASPDGQQHEVKLRKDLAVGRSPGKNGLVLTPSDNSISSTAFHIEIVGDSLTVRNTSSFSQLDIHHDKGIRFLFPGEALSLHEGFRVTVPGSIFSHHLDVLVSASRRSERQPTGTTQLGSSGYQVAPERHAALVGLCVSKFFPDRYGVALLSATDISSLLSKHGTPASAKAVNNKLQRIRDDIAKKLGIYLDTREDLADWAIKNDHVTKTDVDSLLALGVSHPED